MENFKICVYHKILLIYPNKNKESEVSELIIRILFISVCWYFQAPNFSSAVEFGFPPPYPQQHQSQHSPPPAFRLLQLHLTSEHPSHFSQNPQFLPADSRAERGKSHLSYHGLEQQEGKALGIHPSSFITVPFF